MTTGNGTVRLNPNLYKNGKVCLSILGYAGATRALCSNHAMHAECPPSTTTNVAHTHTRTRLECGCIRVQYMGGSFVGADQLDQFGAHLDPIAHERGAVSQRAVVRSRMSAIEAATDRAWAWC